MKHCRSCLIYYFKHQKVRQKYSAARRIFNSLLGVWKCGQRQYFVFDILHVNLSLRSGFVVDLNITYIIL